MIIDLSEETVEPFFRCLSDDETEWSAGACRRAEWFRKLQSGGLRGKLAEEEDGELSGMVQYGPIEHLFPDSSGLYFVYCIWVKRQKKGPNYQKKGIGSALLHEVEEDVRRLGAKGLVVWGIKFPFWMQASWFRKKGYTVIDTLGMARLLWKPFEEGFEPPRWMRAKKRPEKVSGQVTVTAFISGWCTAANSQALFARQAAEELGERVVYREIDLLDQENIREWGLTDTVFVDGKEIGKGPPMPYKKIKKKIQKTLKKLS